MTLASQNCFRLARYQSGFTLNLKSHLHGHQELNHQSTLITVSLCLILKHVRLLKMGS